MTGVEFFQEAPRLGNQWAEDRPLRSYLNRVLPEEVKAEVFPVLARMGELSGGLLYEFQLADRSHEPSLIQWDPWGRRVDRIEVTPLWREAKRLACEFGLVALPYERPYGALSRVCQLALAYLFHASSDVYTCPLAMSDGAAKTLLFHRNQPLIDRALPRLVSREPDTVWTAGQWMTEKTGGSDVGGSQSVARKVDGTWRLYGTKWFTSATTSEMALTLARPEGNGPGGRGLALFYLETRQGERLAPGIAINRLKEKLGTRKVPTAELTLDGVAAEPVAGLADGVRAIAPMLNVTRLWNSFCAVAEMRRGVALARDYARRREAFGAKLSAKPLHVDTMAGLQAECEAALHLAFYAAELLGKEEHDEGAGDETRLLRLVTPLVKITTAKQAVAVSSEVLECFGGAGYVEDTGLPRLLRDAQVLPIWEGTTNVLSLDALRAMASEGALDLLARTVSKHALAARHVRLREPARRALEATEHAVEYMGRVGRGREDELEANARRVALTLGRALALALLVRHAQWCVEVEGDARAAVAAERFAQNGVDMLQGEALDTRAARALAADEPLEP